MAASHDSFRTPLSRARGLGPSHTGVSSFIAERVSSIALAPLCLWAVWAAVVIAPTGYLGAAAFLHNPIEATLAVLLVAISFQHTHLGMRVVIEDYIGGHMLRLAMLLLNSAVALVGGALGVVAILKVAFAATV